MMKNRKSNTWSVFRSLVSILLLTSIEGVLGQIGEVPSIELTHVPMEGIEGDPIETIEGAKYLVIRLSDVETKPRCENLRCFILICTANAPILWKFDGMIELPGGNNSRIITQSQEEDGIVTYSSELSIRDLKTEYSGWYGCSIRNQKNSETWRYVFIQDVKLTMLEKDFVKTVEHESNPSGTTLTVPCRPNNPNMLLLLFQDGVEIDRNNGAKETESYKATSGFRVRLNASLPYHGLVYECRSWANNANELLIVRMVSKAKLNVEPNTPFVRVNTGEKLNLQCFKHGISTQIILKRNLNKATFSNFTISKVTESDSGFYSCIELKPNVEGQSFLDANILFNWNVVVLQENVRISLQNDPGNFETVICDSNSNSAPPNIEHCPCVSESQCDAIQKLINTTIPNNECRRLNPEMCSSIRVSSQKQCEPRSASCKTAKMKASGFISCFSKISEQGPGLPNCDEAFIRVIDNVKNPDLVGRSINKRTGDCLSIGGQDERKGGIWISGACNVPFGRNGTLVCYAHRRYFVGGIEWSFIQPGKTTRNKIIESSDKSEELIRFNLREEGDNVELVKASLTLRPSGQIKEALLAKVFCSARHTKDLLSDEVGIDVNFQELVPPSFVSGEGSHVTQRMSLNSIESLDCAVVSFPIPNITWYWLNETNNGWIKLDWTIRKSSDLKSSVTFSNINITDQNLIFEHFRKENEGTYKCQVVLAVSDVQTYEIERIFTVSVFDWVTILIIVIVVLVVLAVLTGFLAFFYRQRFRVEQSKVQMLSDREIEDFVNGNVDAINPELDIGEQAHLLPYNKTFEFPLSKLRFDKQLGAGAYGTVMKAVAEGIFQHEEMTIVAVKTVHPNADILYFKALLTELKIMIHIGQHLNVVSILGAVTETLPMREVYLIVEYCKYGNLQMYLHKNRKSFVNQLRDGKIVPSILANDYKNVNPKPITKPEDQQVAINYENVSANFTSAGERPMPEDSGSVQPLWRNNVQGDYMDPEINALNTSHLVSWSYQIAKGMEHLAIKKVIHGDLAARNVLIADNSVIKIADFGLARQVYKDANYIKSQSCPLPVKWMAIESLRALQFSTKSDVWAFGVVLWEMFTLGDNPYPGISVDDEFLNKLESGFRMTHPKYSNVEMYDVMLECWRADPDDRPSFQSLVGLLTSFLTSAQKESLTKTQKLRDLSLSALESAKERYTSEP